MLFPDAGDPLFAGGNDRTLGLLLLLPLLGSRCNEDEEEDDSDIR